MNEERPWIAEGSETSQHEDFLIGNRAGLEALKSAIERALYGEGESLLHQPGIHYVGIRVVHNDPRRPPGPHTLREKLQMLGIGLVLLLCFLVFLFGLYSLPELF
jgi:hypothetical protein